MKTKIVGIEILIKQYLSDEDSTSFLSRQRDFLTGFRTDLEEQKRRKWHRDIADYQTGKIYIWTSNIQYPSQQWNSRQYNRNAYSKPSKISTASPAFLGLRPDRKESVNLNDEGAVGGEETGRTRNTRQNRNNTPRQAKKTK